jgi:16S rRNA G1207 methylase RsmC
MNEHYYTARPTSRPRYGVIKTILKGKEYEFLTASGVFSYKRIDKGTELLVRNMKIGDDDRVLDLGCGYGVIGIVASCRAGHVVLTELNQRAVELARENLRRNGVENAEVRHGNLYEPVRGEKFDVILCNLPISAGLKVVFGIIEESDKHLTPKGTLQVVVRKGAKRIEGKLLEVFGNVTTLARKSGYRVFLSRKPG